MTFGEANAIFELFEQELDSLELIEVSDHFGDSLNRAIRFVKAKCKEDEDLWAPLLRASSSLRWSHFTLPGGQAGRRIREQRSATVIEEAGRIADVATTDSAAILRRLSELAVSTEHLDSPVGAEIEALLNEVAGETCVLVCVNEGARPVIEQWVVDSDLDVDVSTALELSRRGVSDQAYLWGPPRLFGASVSTAPRARRSAFVYPSWVYDARLEESQFAAIALGGISPKWRLYPVEVEDEQVEVSVSDLVPQIEWPRREELAVPESNSAVPCHKLLLSGGYSLMLDMEGGRVRVLFPKEGSHRLVRRVPTADVGIGDYLVARLGVSESTAVYELTVRELGPEAPNVQARQSHWKSALSSRIADMGPQAVVDALHERGVATAYRAPAWVDMTVSRPNSDPDFRSLLEWLCCDVNSMFEAARAYRTARSKAVSRMTSWLAETLNGADLEVLQRVGQIDIASELGGISHLMATRVLAISPNTYLTDRHNTRRAVKDEAAEWLE